MINLDKSMAVIEKASNGGTDYSFWFLDIVLVNSFVIYKETNQSKASLLNFKRDVAKGLLTLGKKDISQPAKGRHIEYSVPLSVRFVNVGVHMPIFDGSFQRLRCEVCSKKGIQSRPSSKCSQCNVHLCCNAAKSCFYEFHNAK